jgi:hypothetical protein
MNKENVAFIYNEVLIHKELNYLVCRKMNGNVDD